MALLKKKSRARLILVFSVFVIFGVIGVVWTNELDRRNQLQREESRFKAVEVTNFLSQSLEVTKAHISGVAALFKASNEVTEYEFHDFVMRSGLFESGSHLRAISIAPEITSDEIQRINEILASRSKIRGELGYPPWVDIQSLVNGVGFPVTYVESPEGRTGRVGFDLLANEERVKAAKTARTSGDVAMTQPINLAHSSGIQSISVLLLTFIEDVKLGLRQFDETDSNGAFIAVEYVPSVHFSELLRNNQTGLGVVVEDITDIESPIQLYSNGFPIESEPVSSAVISFANRDWQINFYQLRDTETADTHRWLLSVLVLSGTLTIALAYGANRLINSEATLAARVQERTAQLQRRNIQLENTQENMKSALKRAEESNIMKAHFLGTMSHEFRTPLNAIIGFTAMLRNRQEFEISTEKIDEYLLDIETSGEHMLALVNDILDRASLETGKREPELEIFDLVQCVKETIKSLSALSTEKSIDVQLNLASEVSQVRMDKLAVRQIVLNLLSNAIKFSPPNSLVQVELRHDTESIRITVIDNGFGIPAEAVETIADPFVRIHSDAMIAQEGTGLGLSIVKGLAEMHGGELVIHTEHQTGAKIEVRFPAILTA